MKSLKVALLQLMPGRNDEDNLQKGLAACRQAHDAGADIALFPEMWSTGYHIPRDADTLKAAAVPSGGAFVTAFGRLAAELQMAIGVTFLEIGRASCRERV